MSQRLTVALFTLDSPEGRDLQQRLLSALAARGMRTEVSIGAGQRAFAQACLHADIVIVDASVEPVNNYHAMTAQPMTLDHVLVVSRTYLPVNFFGLRPGGAPSYPSSRPWSNSQLVAWACAQIDDLAVAHQAARPSRVLWHAVGAMRHGLAAQEQRHRAVGQIFLSYRSRHRQGVATLADAIRQGRYHQGVPAAAYFLPPGALTYEDELLTEQRHWMFASAIDRILGAAEEVWAYATPDYLESWWTRAELMTLAYRRASGVRTPKLRIVEPATHTVHDPPAHYLPALTDAQVRRMARWYSNSDPATMGPEAIVAMRWYARLPLVGRLTYINDHVWSDAFWDAPLLPCATCRAQHNPIALADVEAFLWLREPGLVRLTAAQLAEGARLGLLRCPDCGTAYRVTHDPHPRYLWMPVRMGRNTGPQGQAIVPLPIYRATA